ncbi:septal ring lytic transglycosylase RlpA family protein [Pontibacter locisalis]|uniref:Probable endolytic peptidoglycan transglycosylase RlpA n=1 Tax=Pontibacter locisalis TaxID=1719035 RepID=A0ABW5IQ11_9BACT
MNLCSVILVLLLSFYNNSTLYTAEGKATYYADRFQGQRTTSGERYDKKLLTAAHVTLPFNTLVQVTNLKNGKSVIVRINDRKARSRTNIIDLSRAAAEEIDLIRAGVAPVKLQEVRKDDLEQQETPLAVSKAESSSK